MRWGRLCAVALLLMCQPAWGQESGRLAPMNPPHPPSGGDQWVLDRIRARLEREGWVVVDLTVYRTNRGILFGFGGLVETPAGRQVVAGTYHQLTGRITLDRLEPVPVDDLP